MRGYDQTDMPDAIEVLQHPEPGGDIDRSRQAWVGPIPASIVMPRLGVRRGIALPLLWGVGGGRPISSID